MNDEEFELTPGEPDEPTSQSDWPPRAALAYNLLLLQHQDGVDMPPRVMTAAMRWLERWFDEDGLPGGAGAVRA